MLTIHVVLSLAALVTGFVVLAGLIGSRRMELWTPTFLATTVLTSVTGLLLPASGFLPSHAVAILSLVVLTAAIAALYCYRLSGAWRWIYVVAAVIALYFNAFVGVVQAFQKIGPLHALAPTEAEPPFAIAQAVVLVAFVALGIWAAVKFRPAAA